MDIQIKLECCNENLVQNLSHLILRFNVPGIFLLTENPLIVLYAEITQQIFEVEIQGVSKYRSEYIFGISFITNDFITSSNCSKRMGDWRILFLLRQQTQ